MEASGQSKRERRLAAREERQRVAAQGRRKAQQRKRLTLAGLIALAVAVLAFGGYTLSQNVGKSPPGIAVADEGREHVSPGAPLSFKANPPSSGTHYATWIQSGFYTEPQDPGGWVHSLEHGYVVILYNCPEACPELTTQLRGFYDSAPPSAKYRYPKLIVTPYKDLGNRLTAVAWNRRLELDQFDADQLMAFFRAYQDKGPEDAP
jgi:hypothetical protein